MQTKSPGTLIQHAIERPVAMETEDAVPDVLYNRALEQDKVPDYIRVPEQDIVSEYNRAEQEDIIPVYNRLDDG